MSDTGSFDPGVQRYLKASRAINTLSAYGSDIRHFLRWGGKVPCTTADVAKYVADHGGKLATSTLRRRVAAIASAHRDLDVADPTKAPLVTRVMHGIQRTHATQAARVKPLLLENLSSIVATLGATADEKRDKAVLLIGFFGALRRSELAALDFEDFGFGDDQLSIAVRKSKTDQLALGRTVVLRARRDSLCPLQATTEYVDKVGVRSGSLFRVSSDGNRLCDRTIARIVKRLASRAGLNPDSYGGHSLRAGFATSASLAGFDSATIALQTGHRTMQALSCYVRAFAFPELPSPKSLATQG